MELDYTLVKFENVNLKTREGVKLRGYFANKYKEEEIMHNHRGEALIFKYPKVQYKVIGCTPLICGIGEGANLIADIGIKTDEIMIAGESKDTFQKELIKKKVQFGTEERYLEYEFLTPWMSLNQNNINAYENANEMEKEEMLKKILIGNILSMAKGFEYTVSQKLYAWIDLNECKTNFKNISMTCFKGRFKVNFRIPDYLGLGKAVSRGYGTIKLAP